MPTKAVGFYFFFLWLLAAGVFAPPQGARKTYGSGTFGGTPEGVP
jgi:hypothetical protein